MFQNDSSSPSQLPWYIPHDIYLCIVQHKCQCGQKFHHPITFTMKYFEVHVNGSQFFMICALLNFHCLIFCVFALFRLGGSDKNRRNIDLVLGCYHIFCTVWINSYCISRVSRVFHHYRMCLEWFYRELGTVLMCSHCKLSVTFCVLNNCSSPRAPGPKVPEKPDTLM